MKSNMLGALATCLLLAACQSDGGSGGGSSPALPAAPSAPSSGPEQACADKLSKAAQVPAANITVASREQTMGGYLIMLDVAGSDAAWRCLVDENGMAEVETTAEG